MKVKCLHRALQNLMKEPAVGREHWAHSHEATLTRCEGQEKKVTVDKESQY